jgi:hypothetical protein
MITRRTLFKSLLGLPILGLLGKDKKAISSTSDSINSSTRTDDEKIPEFDGDYGFTFTKGAYCGKMYVWDENGDIVPHEANDDMSITLGRKVDEIRIGFEFGE